MRTTLEIDKSQWPEIWQSAYRILEQSISSHQLSTWIQPLEPIDIERSGETLKVNLAALNYFSLQWIRDRFKGPIETALSQVTGISCEVIFSILEGGAEKEAYEPPVVNAAPGGGLERRSLPDDVSAAGPLIPSSNVILSAGSKYGSQDNSVDLRYTFENYVVGASNQFAHASAVAVSEHPSKQYNPLFLYSPPGLGKTHLLHAIGNHIIAKRPGARVAYLSAESFVNELIDCLQRHKMNQFRAKYRDSYDLILMDDIQFIAGKNTSEEEFFHTFNALYSSKRQIVLTSDRHPKDIQGLEERIRSRFEWGLVADITPPEIETRIAILKSKAESDDIYLPDDVATFLASCIKSNVRELEGVLTKLKAQSSLTGAEISLDMAKEQLKIAIPEEGAQITVENIQQAVGKYFNLRIQDLKSTTRTRKIAFPRQVAVYLIRKYTGLGYKEIGAFFGGKDHSTIMHACSKIEEGLENDAEIRNVVEKVQNLL